MAITLWQNHKIEDIELQLFLDALRLRYDYDFTHYVRSSLKRRIKQLKEMWQVEHISDMITIVMHDLDKAQEAINQITVPKSSFFRDPAMWRFLREHVMPMLSTYPRLNIWQAGCAHGEETYSLSILLDEFGLLERSQIITTDISQDSLNITEQGNWYNTRFDEWENNYKQSGGEKEFADFFEHDNNHIQIKAKFKKHLDFFHHNLVSDDVFIDAHLVLCRNVLIYFDFPLQFKVLDKFNRSLNRGGHLILGSAESLIDNEKLKHPFKEISANNRIYQKPITRGNHV